MNSEFYKGKRILITGADGFIGSNLTKELIQKEADIIALVHSPNLKNLKGIKDKLKFIYGDITKKEITEEIINHNPEYIFHLAALNKSDNYENPEEILKTNILGTINVIEASNKIKGLKRFILSSTGKVYENSKNPIEEDYPLNPLSAYAISKLTCESITKWYSNKKGLPITTLRLFNTYGPNKIDNVIFFFIKQALKNEEIKIDGEGNQIRDFTYIYDTINAFLSISQESKSINKTINVGGGGYINIRDLAKKIKEITESSSNISHKNADPGLDSSYCKGNLLKSDYNWEPKTNIEEGLKKTIEWVKENEGTI
tara:strand:+ start:2360 stop:3301 length:942 start_codon:yes stop_codon:yes gene_type:complete